MFVDTATVKVKAGDGGNGKLSFRHEKFVDKGGPDGGDGGTGGSVVFAASRNQDTLVQFRYQRDIKAEPGGAGDKRRRHGRSAADLIVQVPVGTVVLNEAGEVLADFVSDGQQAVIAKGGGGGFGNAHFVSSTRQAPNFAEKGEPGEQFTLKLELKMIADVGLIGLPNAGKSTLLSVLSNARPEIADYPFTTLTPNLGVADVDDTSLLLADIPGLIEGAAAGKGLGDEFLRHVERTAVLLHLVDAYQDDVATAYQTVQTELKAYKVDLSKRPQIVVLNKTEGLDKELLADITAQLRKVVPAKTPIVAISAQAKTGLPELLRKVAHVVARERAKELKKLPAEAELPVFRLPDMDAGWKVERVEDYFLVSGVAIERFAARTDFASEPAVQRLRDILRRSGILHDLARRGAKTGDKIHIGTSSIAY